jgi:hypothetical protein
VPSEATDETKLTPAGSVSLMIALVTSLGPRLVTAIV